MSMSRNDWEITLKRRGILFQVSFNSPRTQLGNAIKDMERLWGLQDYHTLGLHLEDFRHLSGHMKLKFSMARWRSGLLVRTGKRNFPKAAFNPLKNTEVS